MSVSSRHHFRFHAPHAHLASVFGDDWFGVRAESFARFFGTPVFLVAQTVVVAIWIAVNAVGLTRFDVYPFILLNLAFSLQSAYASCSLRPGRPTATRPSRTPTRSTGKRSPRRASSDRSSRRSNRRSCSSSWTGTRSSRRSRRS